MRIGRHMSTLSILILTCWKREKSGLLKPCITEVISFLCLYLTKLSRNETVGPQVSFAEANAEELAQIESNSIDLYTIAFGIRNCTHIDRVLEQAYRVLKPGGVFACLEFSKVQNPLLAK